jgi:hypothetical protein
LSRSFRKTRLGVFVRVGITIYVFWNDAPKIRLLTHANCRSGILTFPLCANAEHAAPLVDGIHILREATATTSSIMIYTREGHDFLWSYLKNKAKDEAKDL